MTDKTELEVTREDRVAAWPYRADYYREEDINGWLRGEYDHNRIIQALARHRLATRTPDPTPVAWSDEESFKHLRLLYNYTDNDSHQFTRWQMVVAMSHGMRLARQPAVPADGLVDALEWYADQMCEGLCQGKDPKACAAIGADNCAGCPAVVALAAHRGEA